MSPNVCKLVADQEKIITFNDLKCSVLKSQVLNSFRDQQKFIVCKNFNFDLSFLYYIYSER